MQKKRRQLLKQLEKACEKSENLRKKVSEISRKLDEHYIHMLEKSNLLKDTYWNIEYDGYDGYSLQTPVNEPDIVDKINELIICDEEQYVDITFEYRMYIDFDRKSIWFTFSTEQQLFDFIKQFQVKISKKDLQEVISSKSKELFNLEKMEMIVDHAEIN